jgi:hypothetical protein
MWYATQKIEQSTWGKSPQSRFRSAVHAQRIPFEADRNG